MSTPGNTFSHDKETSPDEFHSLTENLRAARKKLLGSMPITLYEKVLANTEKDHRHLLLPPDDSDLDNNSALQPDEKGKLKSRSRNLRNVLNHDGWEKMKTIEIVGRVLKMTERVLSRIFLCLPSSRQSPPARQTTFVTAPKTTRTTARW